MQPQPAGVDVSSVIVHKDPLLMLFTAIFGRQRRLVEDSCCYLQVSSLASLYFRRYLPRDGKRLLIQLPTVDIQATKPDR